MAFIVKKVTNTSTEGNNDEVQFDRQLLVKGSHCHSRLTAKNVFFCMMPKWGHFFSSKKVNNTSTEGNNDEVQFDRQLDHELYLG